MGSVASVCFENMALPVGAWFLFILFATISPMGRRRVRIRIRRRERGAVSPAVAFAVLVVVLAAALIGFALLEKDDEEGRPAPSPAGTLPEEELTEAKAIELFETLESSARRALEDKDAAMARGLYTPDSPVRQRALRDIRTLLKSRTDVEVFSETERLSVTDLSDHQIELTQVVTIDAHFTSSSGKDITRQGGEERQTIEWVLRSVSGEWRIHDALVVASDPA